MLLQSSCKAFVPVKMKFRSIACQNSDFFSLVRLWKVEWVNAWSRAGSKEQISHQSAVSLEKGSERHLLDTLAFSKWPW